MGAVFMVYIKPGLDTLIYFHYSILPKQKVRTKITTCREDGCWTNGTEVCRPPDNECSTVKLPSTTLYYDVELYATLSMADIERIKDKRTVMVTQFHGSSDGLQSD